MKKKAVAFYIGMLLGLIIIFTSVTPLHLLDSAAAGILSLVPQLAPNPAPQVIPSLREWQGSTGSFTLSSTSRNLRRLSLENDGAGAPLQKAAELPLRELPVTIDVARRAVSIETDPAGSGSVDRRPATRVVIVIYRRHAE